MGKFGGLNSSVLVGSAIVQSDRLASSVIYSIDAIRIR